MAHGEVRVGGVGKGDEAENIKRGWGLKRTVKGLGGQLEGFCGMTGGWRRFGFFVRVLLFFCQSAIVGEWGGLQRFAYGQMEG